MGKGTKNPTPWENNSRIFNRSHAVKPFILLSSFAFVLACADFPSNPVKIQPEIRTASVRLAETQYIPVDPPGDGLVARKVNILCFEVRADNFEARAIELIGKATVEGPPETKEHAFHFRTDKVDSIVPDTPVVFNVLDSVEPESTYTVFRFQFPMNEYSPFADSQGMVKSVTIDEVWGYDREGTRFHVDLDPSAK
jgi:hypothetical protein